MVLPAVALVLALAAAIAGEDEGGADARVARQLHVAVAVADHPALREVELKLDAPRVGIRPGLGLRQSQSSR